MYGGGGVGGFQLVLRELLTQAGEKFDGNAHEAFYYSVLMDELGTVSQNLCLDICLAPRHGLLSAKVAFRQRICRKFSAGFEWHIAGKFHTCS
jgi:hypothetical protein